MPRKTDLVFDSSPVDSVVDMIPLPERQDGKKRFLGRSNDIYPEVADYVGEHRKPVTIRQATPEELAEFMNIKPIKKNNYIDNGGVTLK